jgi:RNA polymerase sigma-70 factor, ECF subfamily
MIAAATTHARSKPIQTIADYARMAVAGVGLADVDDDAHLVRRCKKGDVNAYRQLVDKHERRVISILSRILPARQSCGDTHALSDVEDLAQDVFVLAWRALPTFRGDSRFSTWLYRIATNRAIKEWRRAQRHPGRGWTDDEVDSERGIPGACEETCFHHHDPEALFQLGLRDEQLRRAIESLTEKQRIVVLLHYFEDYSCEEIAEVLECSVGTIWSRLHYACRKLRIHLNAAEIG